jgi:anti-sigma regulatory factor (Ser/Thr protein kinase)
MAVQNTRRARLDLEPTSQAPRQARDFLTSACARWNAARFEDVGSLAVSELVTNAVRHAATDIRLELTLAGSLLDVAVHDAGPGRPTVLAPTGRTIGGRGLAIVAKLAETWGVDEDPDRIGKTVWCRIRVEPDGSPAVTA